ncbi:MAG: hypothetical protein GOP50_12050 [Candidatus Heimdallarchaeota archaeon]|nr:hypothetical protein [Candidatus Heimdallarchaeota archaeon]
MDKRLRVLIGTLILVVMIGSGLAIGIILPQNSIVQMDDINSRLRDFGQLTVEDDFVREGTGETPSPWMFTDMSDEGSKVYDQAFFEFFNVSDRRGYLDYNTPVSYYFVQGELVFDIIINKTIIDYDDSPEGDYVVYAERTQYRFNSSASTLFGNETVLNFNYMWPYYIENFGNGSEYGFQAYIASYLINSELEIIKNLKGWTDADVAFATLNRVYAESEGIVDLGIYLPHNWISVRPAYKDLDFDAATSYKILFNSTYNGHDYSLITGESGSQKYFLDLVRGLYYDPADIIIDPVQLLADIYGIDTDSERLAAMSLAAYLNYFLDEPCLDWLYDNKISYVCPRTAMEWVIGIEDPLLGESFPLVKNETLTSASINWNTDIYYAEKLGVNDYKDTHEIIGIANLPYYEYEESSDVVVLGNYSYVLEGNEIKIVQNDSPLFLAVGQYGDHNGIIESFDVCNGYIYVVEGTNGMEIIDARNPMYLEERSQWSYYGFDDMYDVDTVYFAENGANASLILANGIYGVDIIEIDSATGLPSDNIWAESADGTVYAIDVTNETSYAAYAALGPDGINTFTIDAVGSDIITLANHYNSLDFPELTNVIDVQVEEYNLYVLDEVEGLLIFQLGIVAGVIDSLVGQYAFPPGTPFIDMHVDIDNNLVYLTLGEDGLVVVDISTKSSPVEDSTFSGIEHKGTALGVYAIGNDIYLADYTEGLVHLTKQGSNIIYMTNDQLHTFSEQWNRNSKVQFGGWDLGPTAQIERIAFNKTYSSYSTYPGIEKGLRLQWSDTFLRPFSYTSETDTALFFDEIVYYYKAEYQIPYRQMEEYELYWMHDANFINSSYIYAGMWNQEYTFDFNVDDFFITLSFPGQPRDQFHMHEMFVEPVTGSVVERRDRVQYNTFATDYLEFYDYLDPFKFGLNEEFFNPKTDLEPFHFYPTWHTTFPGLTGKMGTLFWQEDVHKATEIFYEDIKEEFLNQIKAADASRTGGAFGAMFLITVGFVIASVVLQRTKPKEDL